MALPTPPPPLRLNFGEAFTFLFRDPHWLRKCALTALFSVLSITFIPYLFLAGYWLTLSERVMRLEPQPLPAWTDFGTLLRKGWRVFLVRVVYYAPILLISAVIMGLVLVIAFAIGGFGLFTGSTGTSPASLAPILLIIPLALLLIPFSLALPCILPAADAQLVLHEEELEPAFRFGAVFAFIRRNLGQYALMVVLYVGAAQVIGGGTSILFQISGNSSRYTGFGLTYFAILGVLVVVVRSVNSIIGLYLGCFLAHMIGQLCWYEREVRGHEH